MYKMKFISDYVMSHITTDTENKIFLIKYLKSCDILCPFKNNITAAKD